MNIFLREIKINIKPFVFWSIGIFLLVAASMVKYTGFTENTQAASMLIDKFPKIVLAMFGMSNLDITTLSGYYGVIMFFAFIMGAIYSINIGSKSVAYEINEKTSEFIYTKPVSRTSITFHKMLASFVMIFMFCLVTFASSFIGIAMLQVENTIADKILLLNISLFFTMLVYYAIGAFASSMNAKKGNLIASLVFLFTYIIGFIYDVVENNKIIQFFTPLKYFDVSAIIKNVELNMLFIFLSLFITFVLSTLSMRNMCKKDL